MYIYFLFCPVFLLQHTPKRMGSGDAACSGIIFRRTVSRRAWNVYAIIQLAGPVCSRFRYNDLIALGKLSIR